MNYQDYLDTKERLHDAHITANRMPFEEFVALDMAQQIEHYKWEIQNAEEELKRLTAALAKLAPPADVTKVPKFIMDEYRPLFRRRDRKRYEQLYGFTTSEASAEDPSGLKSE